MDIPALVHNCLNRMRQKRFSGSSQSNHPMKGGNGVLGATVSAPSSQALSSNCFCNWFNMVALFVSLIRC